MFKLLFHSCRKDWILICICFGIMAIGAPIIWTQKIIARQKVNAIPTSNITQASISSVNENSEEAIEMDTFNTGNFS